MTDKSKNILVILLLTQLVCNTQSTRGKRNCCSNGKWHQEIL